MEPRSELSDESGPVRGKAQQGNLSAAPVSVEREFGQHPSSRFILLAGPSTAEQRECGRSLLKASVAVRSNVRSFSNLEQQRNCTESSVLD
jgi:hypothetical protein